MKKIIVLLSIGALVLANVSSLHAQIVNGSFTDGLNGWVPTPIYKDNDTSTVPINYTGAPQALSNTNTVSSGLTPVAPPSGTTQALIQSTDGLYPADPTPGNTATISELDTALGLSGLNVLPPTYNTDVGDIRNFGGPYPAEDGQAIVQTFSVATASTLSFDFSFQSNDFKGFDSAGYVLDGTYYELASPTTVEPASGPAPKTGQTDYENVKVSLSAGQHTLGFVSYNTTPIIYYSDTDNYGASSLLVTDIETTPEPRTLILLALGFLTFLAGKKLRPRAI